MSAVDILVQPDRALIFTDAAVYDGEGRLQMIRDKCRVTADGALAVTGQGNAWFGDFLVMALDRKGWSIDDIADDGGAFLEWCFARGEPEMLERTGKSFNAVWIVGWSERDGAPKVAQWTSVPPAGVHRFSIVDSTLAPELSPAGYARVQSALGPQCRETADYVKLGLEVMKAQRLETGDARFGAEGKYLVGGHVQLAEVTASGITKRVLIEWPEDRIGERIRPTPALDPVQHASVTPLASMNRAERRRLEKLSRRRAA